LLSLSCPEKGGLSKPNRHYGIPFALFFSGIQSIQGGSVMKTTGVFEKTVRLIEDRLSLNTRRQELVASNIANVDTPGYVAKDISFEEVLKKAMEPKLQLVSSHPQMFKIQNLKKFLREKLIESISK
jgi:hypothetical protein